MCEGKVLMDNTVCHILYVTMSHDEQKSPRWSWLGESGCNKFQKPFEDNQKLLVRCGRADTFHPPAFHVGFGHLPCGTLRSIMGKQGLSE